MFNRIALFAASIAAALVLAAGFALAGVSPQAPEAVAPVAATTDAPTDAPVPTQPQVQVDTVYLAPAVPPEEVVTKVVRTATAAGGGENDGENEGGDD